MTSIYPFLIKSDTESHAKILSNPRLPHTRIKWSDVEDWRTNKYVELRDNTHFKTVIEVDKPENDFIFLSTAIIGTWSYFNYVSISLIEGTSSLANEFIYCSSNFRGQPE